MDRGHLLCQERPSMAKSVAKSYEGRKIRSRPKGQILLGIVAGASFNDRWPASIIHILSCIYLSILCVCGQSMVPMSIIPPPLPQTRSMSFTTHDSQLQRFSSFIFSIPSLPSVCVHVPLATLIHGSVLPSNIVPWLVRLLHATIYTFVLVAQRRYPPAAHGPGLLACSFVTCSHSLRTNCPRPPINAPPLAVTISV